MRNRFLSTCVLPFLATCLSCHPSSVVAAHDLDISVDYGGTHAQAVLAFADLDPTKYDTPGDSTCGLFSGNCEVDLPLYATVVSGNAAIVDATMTVGLGSGCILYSVFLNPALIGNATTATAPTTGQVIEGSFLDGCGESELAKPEDCTDTVPCTMTATEP